MEQSTLKNMPSMLITIDTEGDDLWSKPRQIETRNSEYLYRFQDLCESKGFKPTYLTNFEMARCETFVEFGRQVIREKTGEIGMHLHAWNSPPINSLTEDDYSFHPYLIEYPATVIKEKVSYMTKLLEDVFQVSIKSHRAGRWGFNEVYAKVLVEHGYCVDCSVTPHVSWKRNKGDPNQTGGTNYLKFPEGAYFVDLSDIRSPGVSKLLELPVTIISPHPLLNSITTAFHAFSVPRRIHRRNNVWLRPNGNNLEKLLWVVEKASHLKRDYVQFMLHSSELMPAGSPTFRGTESIESLYENLEALFERICDKGYVGRTLYEHYGVHEDTTKH